MTVRAKGYEYLIMSNDSKKKKKDWLMSRSKGDLWRDDSVELPVSKKFVYLPQHKLLKAMLQVAHRDMFDPVQCGTAKSSLARIKLETRAWVASNQQGLFSFIWICEHLGLDVDYVRKFMRKRPSDHRLRKEEVS